MGDKLPRQAEERAQAVGPERRSGVVTLLFTDVVGSTALKERLGDRAGVQALDQHHALVRETLAQFKGAEEIVVAGDSFLMLFPVPSEGVKCALVLQQRLAAFNAGREVAVPDRMGLHIGEVLIQELGSGQRNVHGIQVDTCARVMGLAQGGQILMTRPVFDNARQSLKGEEIEGISGLDWLNHGRFELKGVGEPVEICEVRATGTVGLSPPTTSEKARRVESAEGEAVLGWRPAVGTVVPNTQWVLEEKLGEGGFGEVWLGRHQVMKERRVFKFCFRADRVRSLKREMTLFRLIKERIGDHPNIVALREVYFEQPPYYVEEDYVAGQNLVDWCSAEGGVDKVVLETKLEIVAQIADALQAAHDAGVIHRDVKPANILVASNEVGRAIPSAPSGLLIIPVPSSSLGTANGSQGIANSSQGIASPALKAKLTDFGIGQVISDEVLSGVTKAGFTQTMFGSTSSQTGSQMYMAPELLAGKAASTRSDIYSLGVVLYQLLIGDFRHPLTVDWSKELPDALLREDLGHCFAWKPEERFAGVAQLARNVRTLRQRQDARAKQQAEQAARERAAYRSGIIRTISVAAVVVAAISLLALHATRLRQTAQRQELMARQRAYAVDMNLARLALSTDNVGRALQLLQRQRPEPGQRDLRGWEWRYLWRRCQSEASFQLCQLSNTVSSVAVSPDGSLLALSEIADGGLSVWSTVTQQRLACLAAGSGHVRAVFSPRDLLLAYSSETKSGAQNGDYAAWLWDAKTQKVLQRIRRLY